MAKNLSKTGFKVKIEQFYENVVIRKVGPNWYSGGSPKDLVKSKKSIIDEKIRKYENWGEI